MKIWKQLNKKEKKSYWHGRFRVNNIPFRPKAETKDELLDLIADIRSQEKTEKDNKKYNLSRPVITYFPTLKNFWMQFYHDHK